MPEYTISLLIWIIPIILISIFFTIKKSLTPEKIGAAAITIITLAAIGIILDLLFAHTFFTFPNKKMICGIMIHNIPIEEFIFYITGFWFILFVYIFCDEYWLLLYNVPDEKYARFKKRLRRMLFLNYPALFWGLCIIISGCIIKRVINPEGLLIPGYFIFLAFVAYIPMSLFYRVTKRFVNWRAFITSLLVTLLISIIWEVTLALPRGYWGYRKEAMIGIFVNAWNQLPIEAVTVWIFCSLVILVYEFLKICFFTPAYRNSFLYGVSLRVGKESPYLQKSISSVNKGEQL